MVEIVSIARKNWESEPYRSLLLPYDSCRFYTPNTQLLGYAAFDQGKPVGLMVASPIIGGYELEHLYVLPSHRRQGIARKMTNLLIDTITQNGDLILTALLPSDHPDLPILKQLTTGPGWSLPKPFLQRYHHDVYALNPPWFARIPPLPTGFEEFPWGELTDQEAQMIHYKVMQGAIPTPVSPVMRDKNRIELSNSLGLRYDGEVVAWMITHRVGEEMIRYSALYIDPRFRHKGLSIRLVVNAIQKQQQSPIQWGYYEILTQDTLPSWNRFVQRRIVPYGQKIESVNSVWKKLQSD